MGKMSIALSKISIFGCHVSKIEKNGEQDCSPFGQSLVEILHQSRFCPLPNRQQQNSSNERTVGDYGPDPLGTDDQSK